MNASIADDVAAVGRLSAVPTILKVVANLTGLRFAAVARVTDKSWTACAVYDQLDFGLAPGGELVLESTICNEIRGHGEPVIFGHASAHPHFSTHATPKLYGFESYISVPIVRSDGSFFGTLCALDPLPAKLDDPNVLRTFELFTQLIAAQLDAEERLQSTSVALLDSQETAKLREQFIAVLGHDLRTPLQAITLGTQTLQALVNDARVQRIVGHMQRSTERMGELTQNILDFARGRLGGGIPVLMRVEKRLADDLRHVVAEVRSAYPERLIEASIAIARPVECDAPRIAQLLTNLLANAVVHGAADRPVRVAATGDDASFVLAVENGGARIPEDKIDRLFQPFSRIAGSGPQPGLGLGLYIAAEIAKAHGGTLAVASDDALTRFEFRMPIARA